MSKKIDLQPGSDRELILCRVLDAPREAVYRAWTDPRLLVRWFAPHPWTTARAEMDVRAGGASLVVMRSPEGTEMPCPGTYLEVVPGRKLVSTDAYARAWEPNEKPFMTLVLTFEDEPGQPGKTRYTARALHWSVADREAHEKMGFHEGWGLCTDQLEALAAKL
jgi:uncharacterized protein YndB with AHSA1/START domain